MRYLILSDIHANFTALEAALAVVVGRWEKVICLGDVVGYGPDPNEVIDQVRALQARTIRGNHDKAACGLADASDFNSVARTAANWTREHLRADNLTYLQQLPPGPLEADGLAMVHGALHDEDEYVFAPAQALDSLLESPSRVTFFGHTHFQGGFSFRDDKLEVIQLRPHPGASFAALQVDPKTRYLLNPGSIGQPRDGDPRAALAIADLDHAVVEFWRVPYNIDAVQQRMKRAGLPEPLILRLAFGR
ncbi:MAG TPA: metallophosphoesterase family protein [Candidatus Acidoferrales bacterium]|jgi:diadenosine tetraphosphatase ApaH/serine/threonine PP2A family protein phosphatase|nr:metallophosphoesterase family protein [Candidatus Acidoferrales bacterium]